MHLKINNFHTKSRIAGSLDATKHKTRMYDYTKNTDFAAHELKINLEHTKQKKTLKRVENRS